jgi:hypothetical protein
MPDTQTLARILCETLDGDELEILREDPFEAIPLIDPEVTIELVSYEPGEGCSVEGLYHEATRSITVQAARSSRRTRFTAIHEFGHDRSRHIVDVARHLTSFSAAASRREEEGIADAFAGAVLIPDHVVDSVLDGRQATAKHLVELFHHPRAVGSREACCVRVAQRMRGEGYVVLAEGGVLRFCATVGGAYSIQRNTSQERVGLLARAATHASATDVNARLQFPDGRFTREYAGQAVTDGLYTFAVLTDSSAPPWGGWVPPRRTQGEAPEIFCQDCDEFTEAWQRCDTNGSHRVCSSCGWCDCRAPKVKVPERVCQVCFIPKRFDLFPDGGDICKDCI